MSLIISLGLMAIAWLLSVLLTAMLHVGHIFAIAPLWLEGLMLAGILSLFIRDR